MLHKNFLRTGLFALVVLMSIVVVWSLLPRETGGLSGPDKGKSHTGRWDTRSLEGDGGTGSPAIDGIAEPPDNESGAPTEFGTLKDDVSRAIFAQSQEALDKVVFDQRYSDCREFIKLQWLNGIPYRQTRRLLEEDSLAALYQMLEDPQYASRWPDIAKIIGFISEDANSVPELVNYIRRREDWSTVRTDREGVARIVGKVKTLLWVGLVGGETANTLLRKAVTLEGARELAKEWIDGELPGSFGNKRSELVELIQGSAAIGIVHSQHAENMRLVEQEYRQVHADCEKNKVATEYYNQLCDAMAIRDLIAEKGMKEYLGSLGAGGNELSPYLKRYSWFLRPKQ